MKIITTKKYAQQFSPGTGFQFDRNKVKELISQGININQAIRIVYPDIREDQIEEMKNYFKNTT